MFYLEEWQGCFSWLKAECEILFDGTSTQAPAIVGLWSVWGIIVNFSDSTPDQQQLWDTSNSLLHHSGTQSSSVRHLVSRMASVHRASIICRICKGSQSLLASSKIPSSCQPYSNAAPFGRKTDKPTLHLILLGKRTPRKKNFPKLKAKSPWRGRLIVEICKITHKKMKGQEFQGWYLTSILETSTLLRLPELKCGLSTLCSRELLTGFKETPCNCQRSDWSLKKTIPRNHDCKQWEK